MNALEYPHRTLSDFSVGQSCQSQFTITPEELSAFIVASGDSHPLHTNLNFARQYGYRDVLLHGMCIAARSSKYITYEFVGCNGVLVSMTSDFRRPVFANDLLLWSAETVRIDNNAQTVEIKWKVLLQSREVIQRGTACAWISKDAT